jgi:hypothetical protein
MKINRISPDIYEIEDFITLEQQKKVLEYCTNLDEKEWWQSHNEDYKRGFFYGRQKLGQLPDVFSEIDENISNLFSGMLIKHPVTLQRHKDSRPMAVHKDYHTYDPQSYVRFGVVVYYNDDYVGGELSYPSLEISHKPKARSLVLHGGNIRHGTKPVTDGPNRYFSTTFIRGSVDKPVILNKDLFGDVEQSDGSAYP